MIITVSNYITKQNQKNIPVGCVQPVCQPYVLRPPDVSTDRDAQVNKFEEVFSVCHQISLTGAPISHIRGGGGGWGKGGLYSEVQCIIGNGHIGIPPPWTECLTDGETRLETSSR